MVGLSGGGAQPNISQNIIRKLKIPVPAKDAQKRIIDMFTREQVAIQANNDLVNVFNTQIQERIAEVWGK